MERVAFISDVHGNMTAFDAVLADIDARNIGRVFNLGDVFGKGPNGSAAVRATRERCEATVYGNWDVLVHKPREEAWPPLTWWLDEMTADDRNWLRSLPYSIDIFLGDRPVRMFHASADSVFHRVRKAHSDDEFRSMFENTAATGDGPEPDIVVYGDIHAAYVRQSDGKTLINAGSVGNPLDAPTASYLVLSANGRSEDVRMEIVRVPYDIEREIAIAAERGMPELQEYAGELRTSVYRGVQRRNRA
jgi:predicted phosphodiesterase